MKHLKKLTLALTILGTSSLFAICTDLEERQNELSFEITRASESVDMYQELYDDSPIPAKVIQFINIDNHLTNHFQGKNLKSHKRLLDQLNFIALNEIETVEQAIEAREERIYNYLQATYYKDNITKQETTHYPSEVLDRISLGTKTRNKVKNLLRKAKLNKITLESENEFITKILTRYCK